MATASSRSEFLLGILQVKKVDSIRQSLRMRGFRCNLVYTRACTRLNVVPLSASRPLALR